MTSFCAPYLRLVRLNMFNMLRKLSLQQCRYNKSTNDALEEYKYNSHAFLSASLLISILHKVGYELSEKVCI